jgi:hypothetical protein
MERKRKIKTFLYPLSLPPSLSTMSAHKREKANIKRKRKGNENGWSVKMDINLMLGNVF